MAGPTATAIPAADLTARAADAPIVVGRNALEIAYGVGGAANVVSNAAGDLATADNSASGHETRYLVDRLRHTTWKHSAANTAEYIVIDTGSANGSKDVDFIGIDGHNWAGQTLECKMNDTAPPVGDVWANAVDILGAVVVPSSETIYVNLQGTNSYKARYIRFKISGASLQKYAAQLWAGKAIQFPVRPFMSSDLPDSLASKMLEVETSGGIAYRYGLSSSLVQRALSFKVPKVYNDTFFTNLKDWFSGSDALNGGIKSFWWLEDPTSNLQSGARFMRLTNPTYRPAFKGVSTYISFDVKENGS